MALTLLAGCTGGGQGDGDDRPDGDPAADTGPDAAADAGPPMCEARPPWVITAVEAPAPCIGRVPVPGERVTAVGGRLVLAELDLPLVGGDCEILEASGCALDADAGDRREVRGTLDVAGGRLVLDGERVEGYRAAECAPVTLSLAPAPMGCLPGGLFAVSTPLTLTEGTCDLSWPDATVTLAVAGDDTGEVRWGDFGQSLDISAVDRAACAVTAESGFLLFNGAARTIRLTAAVDGDRVDFTIEDALDDTSDFGETCVGARFTGQGTRLGPDGPPRVAMCDPLPFICGDGVCAEDAGEQCEVCPEDCGCDGAPCLRYADPSDPDDAPPRHACAPGCDDGVCPDDQRCIYPGEFDGYFVSGGFRQRVCLDAAGDAPRGSACVDSRACADGLICVAGQCLQRCADVDRDTCGECQMLGSIPVEVCLPECSPQVTDQCGAGACASYTLNEFCSTVDRVVYFCLPEFIQYGCVPGLAPSFGEPCGAEPRNACAVDLACVGEQCDREGQRFECGVQRCSRRCETDDDCAEPLGVCTSIEVPGDAPRRWCTGPQ